jgi:hypothetical protein
MQTRSREVTGCFFAGECRQQFALQAEHFCLLLGFGVVIAEQVEDSVRGQQQHLVLGGVPGTPGLDLGHLRADRDVAKHPLRRRLVRGARGQLVHGHGQHVGGSGLIHQFDVQLLHGRLVHEQDGQFRLRVDVQLFEDEARQCHQAGLVHLDAGFVVNFDAHACSPVVPGERNA